MITIVKQNDVNGYHCYESQSHRTQNWMGDDWIEVPEPLVETLFESGGYCDLTIENGVLIAITPRGRPPEPEPEPEPTADELMDILLGVENDG